MVSEAAGLDPLITEAKMRMRRRRIIVAALALLTGVGVLTLVLRPSSPRGTHGARANGTNALSHIRVPVDRYERTWRIGIETVKNWLPPVTPRDAARARRELVAAVNQSGAALLRIRVWRRDGGGADVVLATGTGRRDLARVTLIARLSNLLNGEVVNNAYLDVVDSKGASVYEWSLLPEYGIPGYVRHSQECHLPISRWSTQSASRPTGPLCSTK